MVAAVAAYWGGGGGGVRGARAAASGAGRSAEALFVTIGFSSLLVSSADKPEYTAGRSAEAQQGRRLGAAATSRELTGFFPRIDRNFPSN